jgi:hypothetical protein
VKRQIKRRLERYLVRRVQSDLPGVEYGEEGQALKTFGSF